MRSVHFTAIHDGGNDMRKIVALIISCIFALQGVNFAYAAQESVELYVSPSGSDGAEGTIDRPLRTLEGARRKVRGIKSANSKLAVNVNFMEGTYHFDSQVEFGLLDSGEENAEVTYRAYNDEKVVFTNAYKVEKKDLKNVTDKEVLKRIPESARQSMKYIDISGIGAGKLKKYAAWGGTMSRSAYPMLFADGDRQELSRWPNTGYVYTGAVLDRGQRSSGGFRGGIGYDIIDDGKPFKFQFNEEEPKKWANAKDFLLEGYFQYDYFYGMFNGASVDPYSMTITSAQGCNDLATQDRRWAARNLLEETDLPGEYYIDYENSRIYWNVPYGMEDADISVSVNDNQFCKLIDVGYVNFEGICFEKTRSTAFQIMRSDKIEFKNCEFSQIGKRGAEIKDSTRIVFDGCDFSYTGGSAIYLDGGDFITLTPSGNEVKNCTFYRWGEFQKSYDPAVYFYDVGMRVANNTFHNGPFSAILFLGNDCVVEYNEIYNVLKGLNDGGAIYFPLSAAKRGNVIAYNYIHDLFEGLKGDASLIMGVYLDDGSCGLTLHHNIIDNAVMGICSTGRDNTIYSNIVNAHTTSISGDNRGETWQYGNYYNSDGSIAYSSRTIRELTSVPYKSKAYAKYPHLASFLEDPIQMNHPAYNSFYDNLTVGGKYAIHDSVVKYGDKIENNITDYDLSNFVDVDNHNYTIRDDSYLKEKLPDLASIDTDKMGCGRKIVSSDNVKMIYPMNGKKNVPVQGEIFMWTEQKHADEYILKIATDKEMKNVVKEITCPETYTVVNGLNPGKTVYYWTVEVKTIGKDSEKTGTKQEPYVFETSYYRSVDKTELKNMINEMNTALYKAEIGEEVGNYTEDKLQSFKSSLQEVSSMYALNNIGEYELNEATENAKKLLFDIKNGTVPGYRNIEDFLKEEEWTGTATFSVNDDIGSIRGGYRTYNKAISANELLCMGIRTDLSKDKLEFVLRSGETEINKSSPLFKGYSVELTKNEIAVYKYEKGISTKIASDSNNAIKDNEFHQIRLGAVGTAGAVKILMYVDGERALVCRDITNPIISPGYMAIVGNADITKASDIPTEVFDPNANDYPDPYYVDMQELLSSKDNWESSGGFTLENGVLKVENGNSVWTKNIIEQNGILRFEGKFTPGSGWQGISIKNSAPEKYPWDKDVDNYLVCVKPRSVEIQTFKDNKNIFYCIDDREVDWNEWHEFELASYYVASGVQLTLKIDGELYIDYIDETPISSAGRFALFDFSKLGFEIRACSQDKN